MSSKSRFNKSSKTPSTTVDHVDGGQADAPTIEDFEEYVHVPEGRSKTQFILLVGLMIFLLIVFIIPAAFQNALTGGGQDSGAPAVRFVTDGGEFTMSTQEFYTAKRLEDSFRRVAMPWIRATPSHAEVATSLLLDRLASESGVRVSDQDLRDNLGSLAESLGGVDAYTSYMSARFPGGAAAFEETVRRGMRIQRFLELSSRVSVAPTADLIEGAWLEEHVEHAFDYVYVETPAWEEAAKAEAPANEVLEAWLAERPSWELDQLKSPETWSLGSAYFRMGDPEPTALFERYPLADDYDVEAAGKTFYTANSYLVYKLDEPRTDDEGNEIRYAPLEEVAEQAQAAARIQASMGAWLADVTLRRATGEEVDLALEAQELGLGWRESAEPQDRSSIVADTEFGGGLLSSQLPTLEVGDVAASVMVSKTVLQVAQLTGYVEPVMPALDEIRDEVVTRWARDRSNELATEFLTELVGEAETMDAEAFAALAAADERIQFGTRDWIDKAAAADVDPSAFEPVNLFVRSQALNLGLYDLEEGALTEPTLSATRDRVYVLRSLGERPMEFSSATPGQVTMIEDRILAEERDAFRTAYMSTEPDELPTYLVETYELSLPASEEADRLRAEEEAKEAAAGEQEGVEG